MKFLIFLLLTTIDYSHASAKVDGCKKDEYYCYNTVLGKLKFVTSVNNVRDTSYLYLNGKEILKADASFIGANPTSRSMSKEYKTSKMIIILRYNHLIRFGQNDCSYFSNRIVDFSQGDKAIISNDFYPPGYSDAEVDWVSWGQKNSVIAFKDGSRFRYQDGLVTMIDDGGHLKPKTTISPPNETTPSDNAVSENGPSFMTIVPGTDN